MSFSKKWQGLAAVAIATALTAGCGGTGADTQPTATMGVLKAHEMPKEGTGKKDAWGHGMFAFLDGLNLTADQKSKIQAIKDGYESNITKEDKAKWAKEFKSLLSAEQVDKQKLSALMTEVFDKMAQHKKDGVALLAKVRGVLTAEQQKAAAVAILDKVGEKKRWGAHGKDQMKGEKLNLTDEQKKAFAWMKKNKASKKAAMASFMLTGDQKALTEAWTLEDQAAKIQKMVDALASMTKAQREQLLAKMQKHHEGMMGDDMEMDEDEQGADAGEGDGDEAAAGENGDGDEAAADEDGDEEEAAAGEDAQG